MHLQVTNLNACWNIITTKMPQAVVGFNKCTKSLKRSNFLDNSYDIQVDFLQIINEPRELESLVVQRSMLYAYFIAR
jgi:hypothetical protein